VEGKDFVDMSLIRVLVFSAAVAVALAPLAAMAADTTPGHAAAELANGQAQWDLAQQQVGVFQDDANKAAQNERMIALVRSEAMRQRQLNLTANANAMEEIAASLANAARATGETNAMNSLGIAQIRANSLVANLDANVANAQQLAITKGRFDELLNAQAQADLAHRLANFISGQLAEQNMANDKLIGQMRADAIHTPAIAQAQNQIAIGAAELLGADLEIAAGALAAISATNSIQLKASALTGHARASLANAMAQAAAAH
jgi:hypothetical protein